MVLNELNVDNNLDLVAVRQRHLCLVPRVAFSEVLISVKEVDLFVGGHYVRVHGQKVQESSSSTMSYSYYDCLYEEDAMRKVNTWVASCS